MRSMQCLECLEVTHPRMRHPSSLRTESSLWSIALLVGIGFGLWQAVTSAPPPTSRSLSTLSAVNEAPASEAVVTHDHGAPRNIIAQVGGWLLDRAVQFVKVAWWTLPIPLLFSIWRQVAKHPACAHCGSRRLIPEDVAA